MNYLPGGGEFGRGARREVRNPVLRLAAAQGILDLPVNQRRPLGILLRQLADQANEQAQISWGQGKGIMAAYWKAVSVYAKHLARVIDPISARGPAVTSTECGGISKDWCLTMARLEGEIGDPECGAGSLEAPLVKELRDQAARETINSENPFEARKQRIEWRAAAEIERLSTAAHKS